MYTKKILSAAAAVAIMSTGAMAFEAFVTDANSSDLTKNTLKAGATEGNGTIMTEVADNTGGTKFVGSSFHKTGTLPSELNLSKTFKGDALIYPAFNQTEGFGTEIMVRNTSDKAIVAKAVLYGGKDSHEVKDFNIYLSAKDVCRFTIEGNKITSDDGSIRTYGIFPHQVEKNTTAQDLTDYREIAFGDTKPFDEEVTEPYGYVVIYGMEQSTGISCTEAPRGDTKGCVADPDNNKGFHKLHDALYAAYAATLDANRTGWRAVVDPTKGAIKNGMFITDVNASPNVDGNITVSWEEFYVDTQGVNRLKDHNATFTDVDNVLTGQVRIYNNQAGRDMLLNATAIENFTDDANETRIIWTEGEYASIADRCITLEGNATAGENAVYDLGCVTADAAKFMIDSAVYNFSNKAGSIENKLLFTQPYKRILTQLNNAKVNGDNYDVGKANGKYIYNPDYVGGAKYQTLETGTGYSFTMKLTTYDEDENTPVAAIGGTIITSPQTTGVDRVVFDKEVQEVNSDQLEKGASMKGEFDSKNGFVDITNIPMPAIVTQMVGSTAGPSAEMNWVYSDKN